MMGPTDRRILPRVGLVCDDAEIAEIVMRGVRSAANVQKFTDPQLSELTGLDAIILWFGVPAEYSVRFLASCLREIPKVPVLGVSALDTDHVVDLIKCGMADHMAAPVDPSVLIRKLQRLMSRSATTVFDTPIFSSLPRLVTEARGLTQRSCARAIVVPQFPATATVILGSGTGPKVEIRDIAILTDNQPGGLSLVADPALAEKLQVHTWAPSTTVALHLNLPREISATPIWTRAKVVRIVMPTADEPNVTIAFQYWLDRLREESLVQRFWIRSQQIALTQKRRESDKDE